jgi:hypothetical protein
MNPTTSSAMAALLALSACGASGPMSSPAAALSPAATEPAPAGGPTVFALPRAPDRAADPLRADGAVRFDPPQLQAEAAPNVQLTEAQPGLLVELQHNAGHLGRCWDRRAPTATSGSVVLHAQLSAEGLVTEQCITEDTVGDPAIVQCVNELIAMGRYPKLGNEPVSVIFPIHFGTAAGTSAGAVGG